MSPRRYIAIIQDSRGYAIELEPAPPEGPTPPMLYTVVKADEHEAEVKRLRAASEALAHAVSASLTHGEDSPLADALKGYLAEYPWSDI